MTVAERLRAGEQLLGTFVQVPHRVGGEVAGALGFDLVCVDAEHAVMGAAAVADVVAGAQLAGSACLVRTASRDATHIATALDAGADGVIVPMVRSAAEAKQVVDAARFPPAGLRGAGPSRASGYGRRLAEYLGRANDDLLVGVQIETADAVERVAEIAAVGGIDLLFVGPGDLAVSVAGASGFGDADLEQLVDEVFAEARRAGCATGIYASSADDAARRRAQHVGLVLVASDIGFLAEGARLTLQSIHG
jgi:4-hydroxy-2-oxoheptanedioate aldolase